MFRTTNISIDGVWSRSDHADMSDAIDAMNLSALQSIVYETYENEPWRIVAQKASSIR